MLLRALSWVWLAYTAAVGLATLIFGLGVEAPGHRPLVYLLLHLTLAALALAGVVAGPRLTPRAQRVAGGLAALLGLPTVFSTLGLVLPHLNPPGWEWTWLAWDRALFGCDPTVAVQRWLAPWSVEVLQIAYASFYLQPVTVLVAALCRQARAHFDASLLMVTAGFLASYLGYVLFPTLPPYRFLDHGAPLQGLWLAEHLNALLDAAELTRHDCFPSGHTMMALVSLGCAWRLAPGLALALAPLTAATVAATVALRYHFVVDVLAGAAGAAVVLWLGRTRPADRRTRGPQTSW